MSFSDTLLLIASVAFLGVGLLSLFPLLFSRKVRAVCTESERHNWIFQKLIRLRDKGGYRNYFEYEKNGQYVTARQTFIYDTYHTPGKEFTIFVGFGSAITISEIVLKCIMIFAGTSGLCALYLV